MPQFILPVFVLTAFLGPTALALAEQPPQPSMSEETGPVVERVLQWLRKEQARDQAINVASQALYGLKAAGVDDPAMQHGLQWLAQEAAKRRHTNMAAHTFLALTEAGVGLNDPVVERSLQWFLGQNAKQSTARGVAAPARSDSLQPVVDTIRVVGGRVEIEGQRIVIEGGTVEITRKHAAVQQVTRDGATKAEDLFLKALGMPR